MLVYISGPYRAATPGLVRANVGAAADTAVELMRMGHAVICPHTMTWTMELYELPDEVFLRTDLDIICRCDALCLVAGVDWRASHGTMIEVAKARELGIPVYASPASLQQNLPMQ